MPLPERVLPVAMRRVAVVALRERLREVLVALAEAGTVELAGELGSGEGSALEALRRLEHGSPAPPPEPVLARRPPDVAMLERAGARALLAGEVELERRRPSALLHDGFAMLVGWVPEAELGALAERLAALGTSLVALRRPRGQLPPTLLSVAPAAEPFRPLLSTYGAIPYADVDPTAFVAATFCLMFGLMFGDLGEGLLIVLAALALRRTRSVRLRALRRAWPLIAAAGASSAAFGVLLGECFGPSHLVPTLWLAPLEDPNRLLVAAVVLGGVLLAAGDLVGIVNRWREGGARLALTAASGIPGLALLLGGGLVALGRVEHVPALEPAGFALAASGVIALALGLRAEAGRGPAAAGQVLIGLFDALLRLFTNVFSFARLAAFGLMHAAIGEVVLNAAGGLTGSPAGDLAAAAVFVAGSAIALALEGLVVVVQALRLEYYELFSRLFVGSGRPFRPWHLPLLTTEEVP